MTNMVWSWHISMELIWNIILNILMIRITRKKKMRSIMVEEQMRLKTIFIYLVKDLIWTEKMIQKSVTRRYNLTATMWIRMKTIHLFPGSGKTMFQQGGKWKKYAVKNSIKGKRVFNKVYI